MSSSFALTLLLRTLGVASELELITVAEMSRLASLAPERDAAFTAVAALRSRLRAFVEVCRITCVVAC